jgi:hypothetical protein
VRLPARLTAAELDYIADALVGAAAAAMDAPRAYGT